MGYLHARGIVHKDLKSKNIFLENGKVIITDFGLFSVSKLCKIYGYCFKYSFGVLDQNFYVHSCFLKRNIWNYLEISAVLIDPLIWEFCQHSSIISFFFFWEVVLRFFGLMSNFPSLLHFICTFCVFVYFSMFFIWVR